MNEQIQMQTQVQIQTQSDLKITLPPFGTKNKWFIGTNTENLKMMIACLLFEMIIMLLFSHTYI